MAITITWNDGVSPVTAFTIPNDVQASLDSFRQVPMLVNGQIVSFQSIQQMMVGIFMTQMVSPALAQFPTTTLTAAQTAANAAQAALVAAQNNAVPNFAPLGSPATIAAFSGNSQSGTHGTALAAPFVVLVTDSNGNPVPGATVTFAVASGGGSISAASVVTNAAGQASTTLTLGPSAGTNTVTATCAGTAGSPLTFTATGA